MAQKTVDPQQMAQGWQRGMASAGVKYAAGIKRAAAAGVNPMALAAAASAKYLANVQAAVASGHYQQRLLAVSPAFWASQATGVGAANLASGATKGAPKYQAFAQRFAPVLTQASAAAAAVPDDGNLNIGKIQAALSVIKAAKGT
jgi:hypothetical protein